MTDIIFRTFRTYKHPYIYDRHTNSVVMLDENEYEELSKVERCELSARESPAIKKLQEYGLLMPNVVEKIEHPGTQIIEHYIKTRMKQLTLQVTQQCNLRCEYCVYSGVYDRNRTHSNQRMDLVTARKAIDFFLERNRELSEVVISFYGGEPLLEFDLIKQCVEYAKSKTEGKRIKFSMTTNGTLLSDSIVDYLVDNGFILCISLDGSKEEHDENRKFVNGKGSFDIIIENIERIQMRYPEYDKHISILTTVNPHIDISCVLEYFSTSEIFSDKNIVFNTMSEVSLTQELAYDEKYYRVRNYEYIKMLFSMIGKLDAKYVSPLVMRSRSGVQLAQKQIHSRVKMGPSAHHAGPCMPGVNRLFVRVDGALFPCERINEALDYFKIGTLEDGLDIIQIRKILNIGKVTERECLQCLDLRHCVLCAVEIEFDTEPSKESKLKVCAKSHGKTLFELYELCVLNEFGLDT